jgi:hypothetical protein
VTIFIVFYKEVRGSRKFFCFHIFRRARVNVKFNAMRAILNSRIPKRAAACTSDACSTQQSQLAPPAMNCDILYSVGLLFWERPFVF